MGTPDFIMQVSEEKNERVEAYKTLLTPHNIRTLDAAINLASGVSEET